MSEENDKELVELKKKAFTQTTILELMLFPDLAINWCMALCIKDSEIYKCVKKIFYKKRITHKTNKPDSIAISNYWLLSSGRKIGTLYYNEISERLFLDGRLPIYWNTIHYLKNGIKRSHTVFITDYDKDGLFVTHIIKEKNGGVPKIVPTFSIKLP